MVTLPVPTSSPLSPTTPDDPASTLAAAFLLGYSGSTRSSYARDLAAWFAFCLSEGFYALDARRPHVDAYARHLAEVEGRSPATVARHLSTLSGFYKLAVDEEIAARNPVAGVRRTRVGTVTVSTGLDREELAALIAAAEADSSRSLALVLLLGLNGLRVSEALGVDVTDLDTERGHRVLRVTRNGGTRATVPLAPRTAEAVERYVADRTTGPLFRTATAQAVAAVKGVEDAEEAGASGGTGQGGVDPSP